MFMQNNDIPTDALMPHGAQVGLTIATGLIAAAVFVYAIAESRRRRDLVPLLLVVGSGLAVFYEPLGDLLSKVYYPERGQWTWITAFGHGIPAFIGLLYFWYMSLGALWLLRQSTVGVSAKQWWTAWTGYLAFAIGLEIVAVKGLSVEHGAPWLYYGNQAFVIGEVPFFTPFSYGPSIDTAVAVGMLVVVRYLPRRQYWLLLPLVPLTMLAGHLMTAWPSVLAMHSTSNAFLLHLGAIGTGACALLLSYLGSQLFRKPWAPEGPASDHLRPSSQPTVESALNQATSD
jgi:hypothetical protein